MHHHRNMFPSSVIKPARKAPIHAESNPTYRRTEVITTKPPGAKQFREPDAFALALKLSPPPRIPVATAYRYRATLSYLHSFMHQCQKLASTKRQFNKRRQRHVNPSRPGSHLFARLHSFELNERVVQAISSNVVPADFRSAGAKSGVV